MANEPTPQSESGGARPADRPQNVDELYRLVGSRLMRSLIEAQLSGHRRPAVERPSSADLPRTLGALYVGTFVAGLRLWGCMIDAWARAIPAGVEAFVGRGSSSDTLESVLARFASQVDWGPTRQEPTIADLLLSAMADLESWQRRHRAKA